MTLPLLVFIGSPYLEAQQGNYYTLFQRTHKLNIHIPTDNKTLENKNNQEKCFIFSCGLAIQPTLSNGISFRYF